MLKNMRQQGVAAGVARAVARGAEGKRKARALARGGGQKAKAAGGGQKAKAVVAHGDGVDGGPGQGLPRAVEDEVQAAEDRGRGRGLPLVVDDEAREAEVEDEAQEAEVEVEDEAQEDDVKPLGATGAEAVALLLQHSPHLACC